MNRKSIRRTLAGSLAATVFVVLSAATAAAQDHGGHTGQTGQQTGHQGHGQMGDIPFDLHFIDMMVIHHEHGVEMARLAEQKGANARVKTFAKKTADDQQRDIATLRGHRQQWYSDRPVMDHAQMMAHMQGMQGKQGHEKTAGMSGHGDMKAQMEEHVEKLRSAEGRAFDLLFLETMTHHHEMAVRMSKEAQTKAEHAEIKEFARKAAAKQQGEIAEMKRIKASLGGSARRAPAKKKSATKKPAAHASHQ